MGEGAEVRARTPAPLVRADRGGESIPESMGYSWGYSPNPIPGVVPEGRLTVQRRREFDLRRVRSEPFRARGPGLTEIAVDRPEVDRPEVFTSHQKIDISY